MPPPETTAPRVEVPCPSAAEVAQIDREVSTWFPGDPTAGVLSCRASEGSADLTYVQATIYDALLFLRRLRFDTPLPWTQSSLYDWLRAGIKQVVTETAANDWRRGYLVGGAVHIVYPPVVHPTIPPTIASLPFSLLVHEARHADVNMKSHNCGDTADQTVADMRAYGVQYYLYQWIAEHSDESAQVKAWARRMAWETRASSAFCAECVRNSGAAAAALDVSLTPSPVVAQPVAGSTDWRIDVTFTAAETAGVDVTIQRIEYVITDDTTGVKLSPGSWVFTFPTVIRAWGSYSYIQPVAYRPLGSGHGATLTATLAAIDVNGNELKRTLTTEVR